LAARQTAVPDGWRRFAKPARAIAPSEDTVAAGFQDDKRQIQNTFSDRGL
jgi:hypothetical protein